MLGMKLLLGAQTRFVRAGFCHSAPPFQAAQWRPPQRLLPQKLPPLPRFALAGPLFGAARHSRDIISLLSWHWPWRWKHAATLATKGQGQPAIARSPCRGGGRVSLDVSEPRALVAPCGLLADP